MIDKFRILLLTTGAVTLPLYYLPLTPEDPFLVPKHGLFSLLSCAALFAALFPTNRLPGNSLKYIYLSSFFLIGTLFFTIMINANYHTGIKELTRWIYLLIIFFTALRINWHANRLRRFLTINLIVSGIVALSAIMEHFEVMPFYLYPFTMGRLYSFFGHQNIMAQYLLITFFFGIGITVSSVSSKAKSIYLILTLLTGFGLLITFSRGAIVFSIIGSLIFLILYKKNWTEDILSAKKTILFILVIATIIAAGVIYSDHDWKTAHLFKFMFERGDTGRIMIWEKTVQRIICNPFAGTGLGNFSVNSHGYVHNEFLQMLAEAGIVGMSGILIYLFSIFKCMRQQLFSTSNSEVIIFHYALFSACLATLGHSMLSYNLHSTTSAFFFFLSIGIICSTCSDQPKRILLLKNTIMKNAIILTAIFFTVLAVQAEYSRIMGHYYFSKAFISIKNKNSALSEKYITKSIQYDPHNSRYYQFASHIYTIRRQLNSAQVHLEKALKFRRVRYDDLCDKGKY